MTARATPPWRRRSRGSRPTSELRIAERHQDRARYGDLKENAEYHAAKEAQGHLETRTCALRHQLHQRDGRRGGRRRRRGFGSVVTVVDEGTGKETTYTLVLGPWRPTPRPAGCPSSRPWARALRGKSVGDVATVADPARRAPPARSPPSPDQHRAAVP